VVVTFISFIYEYYYYSCMITYYLATDNRAMRLAYRLDDLVKEGSVVLGRKRESDIKVPDIEEVRERFKQELLANPDGPYSADFKDFLNVSRKHALMSRTGEGWTIQDLGSTNGTYVNGRNIGREKRQLREGDRITLGNPSNVTKRANLVEFLYKGARKMSADDVDWEPPDLPEVL